MLENLKGKMTEEFKKKTNSLAKFEEAYEKMLKENDVENQETIRRYLKEKKHLILYIEETNNSDKK